MTQFHENKFIEQKFLLPLLVPDVDETEEQWFSRWKKYDMLSSVAKDHLADLRGMEVIKSVASRANLKLEQAAFLARAVRLYYFGELEVEKFADYIAENTGVAPMAAQGMARVLAEQIIKKPVQDTKERMSLRTALDRFVAIKNQVITQSRVMVAGARSDAPGTVERWITDYHLAIGQGRHTAIERGNYLFHNRNTKDLPAADRQRVAMVLKSFDEDMPMVVDVATKELVFPKPQAVPQREGVSMPSATQRPQPVRPQAQKPAIKKDGIMHSEHARPVSMQQARRQNGQPMGYANFSSGQRMMSERKK